MMRLIRIGDLPVVDVNVPGVRAGLSRLTRGREAVEASSVKLAHEWIRISEGYETGHTDVAVKSMVPARHALENVASDAAQVELAIGALADNLARAQAERARLMDDVAALRAEASNLPEWLVNPALVIQNQRLWNRRRDLAGSIRSSLAECAERLGAIAVKPSQQLKEHWWDGPLKWLDDVHDWFEPDDWLVGAATGDLSGLVVLLEQMEISDELQQQINEIKGSVDSLPSSHDPETERIEDAWIAWGLLHGGEAFVDPGGGPCGHTMVCIIGNDIPTGEPGNAVTLGRAAVFNRKAEPDSDKYAPSEWYQFHEYAHVVDQGDVGVKRFLTDYADEAQLAIATGGSAHDDSLLETTADLRAGEALRLERDKGDPYSAFAVSVYDAGYQELHGNAVEWFIDDHIRKRILGGDDFTDRVRRQAIADAMGIDPSADVDYFK